MKMPRRQGGFGVPVACISVAEDSRPLHILWVRCLNMSGLMNL